MWVQPWSEKEVQILQIQNMSLSITLSNHRKIISVDEHMIKFEPYKGKKPFESFDKDYPLTVTA